MNYALEQFIDEAIQLELNAAEVYTIFSKIFPEDANFWATLAWEEKNHAAILKTGKDILVPQDRFPLEILPDVENVLVKTNIWLHKLIEEISETRPDRKTAFDLAVQIESTAGEQHFQRVMDSPAHSDAVRIFQELCEDDIHHLKKIREYMNSNTDIKEIPQTDSKKILVVTGEQSLAKLLKTILESEGDVDVAVNVNEGLKKIKTEIYDLVISDVELPIVDGIQLYQKAMGEQPDLHGKFLFFTAEPSAELNAFFRDENIGYLVKPSSINEIRDKALRILGDKA